MHAESVDRIHSDPMRSAEKTTLARRICSGASMPGCGAVIGFELWPWSGAHEVDTHGICASCEALEIRALADRDSRPTFSELVRCAQCETVAGFRDLANDDPRDVLCADCDAIEREAVGELALGAASAATTNARPFGLGFGELPSSRITQALARDDSDRVTRLTSAVPVAAIGALVSLLAAAVRCVQ